MLDPRPQFADGLPQEEVVKGTLQLPTGDVANCLVAWT